MHKLKTSLLGFLQKRKRSAADLLAALILLSLTALGAADGLDLTMQDSLYQQPGQVDPRIVILGIDDKSMDTLGLYTRWSRQIMADAVNILNSNPEAKPAVIGIDIFYGGESDDPAADAALAEAAHKGGNVVTVALAYYANVWDSAPTINHPYEPFRQSVRYGLANNVTAADGIAREAILGMPSQDIWSFPVAIVERYTGEVPSIAKERDYTLIDYTGMPGDYDSSGYSFSDIFDPEFDPAFFTDCIVMIGPYASGLLDAYPTAIDSSRQMNGVEIHANVVQMLLDGNIKQHLPYAVNLCIVALSLVMALILGRKLDLRWLAAVYAGLALVYVTGAYGLYAAGWAASVVYVPMALVLLYSYQLIYGYVQQKVQQQRVRNAFKKYVDPKLVDRLVESGEADSNAVGVKRNIAVLFVDVRGFTPMSEILRDKAHQVVEILNEYLELTSRAVFDNGGSVDKFIGDATMALFNGFVPLDDYVYQAVKAAWQMVEGAAEVNASLMEKYGADVGFGIGIHCGDAIVGNLGPSFRKDYTAIGDVVNTAARLESNAKRSQILISPQVYALVKERVQAESVGEFSLKGKSGTMEVYQVTSLFGGEK